MALVSMTGFARVEGSAKGYSWIYEVKSVNGKSLDVRSRLPHGHEALEAELRKLASKHFRRGNMQLNLQLTRDEGTSSLAVNEAALEAILKIAEPLQKKLGSPPIKVENLLSLRGVLEVSEVAEDEEEKADRLKALLESADDVFTALAAMRAAEGERMQAILADQVTKIEQLTIIACDCPARQPQAIKARFLENIEKLLETSDQLDPDRLHAEAVIIATRADVQEELDRLFAHVEAARELLASNEAVGRKFDFLAQEFNREANTLCSKANDKQLSHIGLEMKTTIDQLREQVQNIE